MASPGDELVTPHRRGWTLAAAVLVVIAAAVASLLLDARPPAPVAASAPAAVFSADRALTELRELPTEPHPIGSAASNRARDHLATELRQAGLTVRVDEGFGAVTSPGEAGFGRVENVVGTLAGTDPTGVVLLAAHYDSVAGGPGASDDGAAVAAILETVRALDAHRPLRNDLVVLFTDGEEPGLLGASSFRHHSSLAGRRGVALNWEARGTSGPSALFETSAHNAALVRTYAGAAPHPFGDSSAVELYKLLPNNTDFTELRAAGFAGLNFSYIGGSARYHMPSDSIAYVDRGSLQHHGANMLALTNAFGAVDLVALESDHDVTYFRLFGRFFTYPNTVVLPLAVLALALLVTCVVLARRQRLVTLPRAAVGALLALVPVLLAGGLGQLFWTLLVALRPGYAALGTGEPYRPLPYRLAVVALVVLVVLAWYAVVRRRVGPAALAVGALVLPTSLGLALAWVAPGAAYLLSVPVFGSLAGLAFALVLRRAVPRLAPVAVIAGSVLATAFYVLLGVGTFDGSGVAGSAATAAVLTVGALTLLPVVDWAFPRLGALPRARRSLAMPVCAGAVAVVFAVTGLAVDRFDASHPLPTHLAYVVDTGEGVARWVSHDGEPASWTRRYVGARGDAPLSYQRNPASTVWTGSAPVVDAQPPDVRVLARQGEEVRLRVTSPRGAAAVTVAFDRPVDGVTAQVPGRPPLTVSVRPGPDEDWPVRVRVDDPPAAGVTITVRGLPGAARLLAYDESVGLHTVPGFVPRPSAVSRSAARTSDLVIVGRTYRL